MKPVAQILPVTDRDHCIDRWIEQRTCGRVHELPVRTTSANWPSTR
jgi:hypothetical protein